MPPGWTVSEVTGPDKRPLSIERFTPETPPGRVHVKLPQGIPPGQAYVTGISAAAYTPPAWLSTWSSQSVEFPMFRVAGANRDEGAVAVVADEDMDVRPERIEGLVPITEAEMPRFGMAGCAMNLAYRYDREGGKVDHCRRPRPIAGHRPDLLVLPNHAGVAQGP